MKLEKDDFKYINEHVRLFDDYFIFDDGRLYSINSHSFLKAYKEKNGYYSFSITGTRRSVHRFVALAFVDNPFDYEQVNHKDGDKSNNAKQNLEWVNQKKNMQHARDELNKQFGPKIRSDRYKPQPCYINEKHFNTLQDAFKYLGYDINKNVNSKLRLMENQTIVPENLHGETQLKIWGQTEIQNDYVLWANGNVFDLINNKFVSPYPTQQKLLKVKLRNGHGSTNSYYVDQLVAAYFVENPNNNPYLMHLDNNPRNTDFNNLKWMNATELFNHLKLK